MLISNPLKKLKKIQYENSYYQKHGGNMHFFTFMHCRLNWFAYSFVVVHFLNIFSTDWKLVGNYALLYLFLFWKKCFYVILALFANFAARNGSKNRKTSFLNVSWNSDLHPSQGLSFLFPLKKCNSLYPAPLSIFSPDLV